MTKLTLVRLLITGTLVLKLMVWSGAAPAASSRVMPNRAAASLKADPARGMKLYQSCMGCHSIDENDVGPRHRGVVGRPAGVVPGYAYSTALKGSHLVWSPANLDRWLAGPQALVPGAKMFYSVPHPQDRADIIAYLATQK